MQKLRRWEAAGGHVDIQDLSAGQSTVVLTSCDGGAEMERFTVATEDLRSFLGESPGE